MRIVILICLSLLISASAAAQTCDTPSELPVPRFVSLKFNETSGRVGPSFNHPVEWTYQRLGLPMQVVAEAPGWRRVRDPGGDEVWVHSRTLSGRRSVWTLENTALRARPDIEASIIAQVEPQAVLWLERCRNGWCRLEVENLRGWARAAAFWGIYADEAEPSLALEGGERACYRSPLEPDGLAADTAPTGPAD